MRICNNGIHIHGDISLILVVIIVLPRSLKIEKVIKMKLVLVERSIAVDGDQFGLRDT